jgi:hypothetical protein
LKKHLFAKKECEEEPQAKTKKKKSEFIIVRPTVLRYIRERERKKE